MVSKTIVYCDICGREMDYGNARYSAEVSFISDYDENVYYKDVCRDCSRKLYNFIEELKNGVR